MEPQKLYERITADNWIQGDLHNLQENKHCLMGHIDVLARHLYPGNVEELHRFEERCEDRVELAIQMLFPERSSDGDIVEFNDHDDTSVEDVIRVCKMADI